MSKSGRIGFNFLLILVTAAVTGTVSWFATQHSLNEEHRYRLAEFKIDQLDRAVKQFDEFRSFSYIYFFDSIAGVRGEPVSESNSKHATFHEREAALKSCLATTPLLFGEDVARKNQEILDYLEKTPWEVTVQSASFIAKAQTLGGSNAAAENWTELLMQELHHNEYLKLTRDLQRLMAEEIKRDHSLR